MDTTDALDLDERGAHECEVIPDPPLLMLGVEGVSPFSPTFEETTLLSFFVTIAMFYAA